MQTTKYEECHYQVIENQIHEFVFLTNTHEAIAKSMFIVERLYQQAIDTAEDGRLRLLCDFRQSGMPPMRYTLRLIQELDRRYPNRPLLNVAFLHRPSPLIKIALSLMQIIPRDDRRRFFDEDAREEAITWLASDR